MPVGSSVVETEVDVASVDESSVVETEVDVASVDVAPVGVLVGVDVGVCSSGQEKRDNIM